MTKFSRNYITLELQLMTEIYIRLGDYARSPYISTFISSAGRSIPSRLKSSLPGFSSRRRSSSILESGRAVGSTKWDS